MNGRTKQIVEALRNWNDRRLANIKINEMFSTPQSNPNTNARNPTLEGMPPQNRKDD